MKEKTSAGGFLHFGHCKAIAKDDELSDIEAVFISIPLKSGYACPHWKKGVDCVLKKKKGSIHADELRTIVLFAADYNFTNKYIAKRTAQCAKKKPRGHAEEQFRSQKLLTAILHVLNKKLTLDITRQM